MANNGDNLRIQVSFHAESESSYGVLVDLHFDSLGRNTSASRLEWFPKSKCTLEKVENVGWRDSYFLTAPKWLLDKKNVKYDAKISC